MSIPKRRDSLNFGARDLPINQIPELSVFGRERDIVQDRELRPGDELGNGLKAERVRQGDEATGRDPARTWVIVPGLGGDGAVRHQVADAGIRADDGPADVQCRSVWGV